MKISKLIKQLNAMKTKHGNVEVMFQDPNAHGGPFSVEIVEKVEAGEDEFPEDWNMPEGFVFIQLGN